MVRDQIMLLEQKNASESEFQQGVIELQETVIGHVSLEEDELFSHAQSTLDIKTLGRQMQEQKKDVLTHAA